MEIKKLQSKSAIFAAILFIVLASYSFINILRNFNYIFEYENYDYLIEILLNISAYVFFAVVFFKRLDNIFYIVAAGILFMMNLFDIADMEFLGFISFLGTMGLVGLTVVNFIKPCQHIGKMLWYVPAACLAFVFVIDSFEIFRVLANFDILNLFWTVFYDIRSIVEVGAYLAAGYAITHGVYVEVNNETAVQ